MVAHNCHESSRVRASSEVQTQTNCYMYANQFNGPDLLENTIVKLKSVYVRWLVDFDP